MSKSRRPRRDAPLPVRRAAAIWPVAIVLAVVTAAVYAPVVTHGFVGLDDPAYITENPHVAGGLSGSNVLWAFTTGYAANWHPLTWLSHMVDVELFGLSPVAAHVTNVTLHVLNAILLLTLLVRLTGAVGRSAFVAALFALHPLHVESVAWAAERKDVLSTCFGFLALLAYERYARAPADRRTSRFVLVGLLLVCALMAKPMLVTLPFVCLLLDFWPLDRPRTWALVQEKYPLFAIAGLSSLITIVAQRHGGAVAATADLPIAVRVENVFVSYAAYIGKTVWPSGLSVFYPYRSDVSLGLSVTALALLVVVSAVAIRQFRARPYLAVGWFWFLGTLVPVIGFVQAGIQSMADRYTYLPIIGLFIIVAWGAADLVKKWPAARSAMPVAATAVAVLCALVTFRQIGYWQDTVTLWQHAAHVVLGADDARAQQMVMAMLNAQHRTAELQEHAANQPATAIATPAAPVAEPASAEDFHDRGIALAKQGDMAGAEAAFSKAIALKPEYADAHAQLGLVLSSQGRLDDAIAHYREALRLDPSLAVIHTNLGALLANQGKLDDARKEFAAAVKLKPELAEAQDNLGLVLAQMDKVDEARPYFAEAARLKPEFDMAHFHLGIALAKLGKIDEARTELGIAIRLNPKNEDAKMALEKIK